MEASYLERHPRLKDGLSFMMFIAIVFAGTILINTFIFRSFSVSGHSMDNTLSDGDRLIVNRLPITAAQIKNAPYMPDRGPQAPVSGEGLDTVVAEGTIIVSGDNRINNHSYDSRTGLGTIPSFDIIGPVSLRIWPLPSFQSF